MKQYSANLSKGKEIIEYYINELTNEGVTNIPIWTESPSNQIQEISPTSTISISEDLSLIAARRRLSTQDASNLFTSSASPPKAAAIATTTATNFSALSDELETFQLDENSQEKPGRLTE
jgi:hypothetical protein